MASQQSVSKFDTTQLLAVAAVSGFVLRSRCWLSQSTNGKIMRKKSSLMWHGSYQNKGTENKTWHTAASEGPSVGGQASVFAFKGKDKGPAVEKRQNGEVKKRFEIWKDWLKEGLIGSWGNTWTVRVVRKIGPQPPCSVSRILSSARNHFFSPNTSALKSSFHSRWPWG